MCTVVEELDDMYHRASLNFANWYFYEVNDRQICPIRFLFSDESWFYLSGNGSLTIIVSH
jgi:hypothetical protein